MSSSCWASSILIIPMQKIKEITYMHSEGILAGELKHGPLALIDKDMPVIMIIMRDGCYTKCQNALQQVTARSVSRGKPSSTCNRPACIETYTWMHSLSHKCHSLTATNVTRWTDWLTNVNALACCSLHQGRPIIICCQDDPEMTKNAYQTIELPHIVDCLQGILSVIPLQLMSFHLAVLRGFDVSSPHTHKLSVQLLYIKRSFSLQVFLLQHLF